MLDLFRSAILPFEWTHPLITLFADLEPILFWILLVILWLYGVTLKNDGPKHVALDLFWHVLAAFVIYWLINQSLPLRPRPETMSSLPPLISHLPDNSFPSGHALFWWASWWALHKLLGLKRVTYFFFIIGTLTVTARVLAGIHYPGDILVGFFLGWGLMLLFVQLPHHKMYRKWGHDFPIKIASFFWL